VKAFSFHIDPTVKFQGPRKRIRRRHLGPALQLRLPASQTKVPPLPEHKDRPRKPLPKFLNSDREILLARQIRYRDFAISTMQQCDGRWTAGLCRADGGALTVDGKTQAVMMTGSYRAEVLALAEAEIRIDMRQGR
jgi:hypothetical protein